MQAILVAMASLLILFAFEIRHRETFFEIAELKSKIIVMAQEIAVLKAEMKLKKNVYEEHSP
jgi:hypothetical protein